MHLARFINKESNPLNNIRQKNRVIRNKISNNKKNFGFNLKPPYKPNDLLKVDLSQLGKQKSGTNIIDDFDSSKEETKKKKNIDPEEISFMMSNGFNQCDQKTDQGETDLEREEDKSTFEEESRRFNGEYLMMFTQNAGSIENNKVESSSEDDYKPDFEVIEEEIHNNDERDDCKSSDVNSNKSSNFSYKKNGSLLGQHRFPTELEENPYLYYANKAKHKAVKNKNSLKITDKTKFKVDSCKSIESTSIKGRKLSTDQNEPADLLKGKELTGGVIYRPFSPPFQQLTSEQSEIEEVLDTDFVPTKNIDDNNY